MVCGCGGGFSVSLSPQPLVLSGLLDGFGVVLESRPLVLTRGRDFRARVERRDDAGVLVPVGAGQYFFELETAPVKTVWPFTVTGGVAELKVESSECAGVPERTRFQLVFLPAGELEGGDALALGFVRWQG